jgi:putative beta-lysine N-acetyltransferase
MQLDRIENFHGAEIQHGPFNNRIYLMNIREADPPALVRDLDDLAVREQYSKIFAKVPAAQAEPFLKAGYRAEASVPRFYNDREECLFLARYRDEDRALAKDAAALDEVLVLARRKQNQPFRAAPLARNATLRRCTTEDVHEMSRIYRAVFPSYPFPIDDPAYLADTMQTHIDYFCVEVDGQMVALSSAEMDKAALNVEMTDFATLDAWRGHGFAVHLLAEMEPAMKGRGIRTAYTIARAASAGMNITFAKLGYEYGGRLINNTNISGSIESMNVWYRRLGS